MVHNIQVGSGKEDNNYYNSQMLHKLQAEMSLPDGRSDWHKVPVSNIYIFDAMWINNCGSSTLQLMVKKKILKNCSLQDHTILLLTNWGLGGKIKDFMVLYDHLHHNNFMGIVLG